MSNIKPAPNCHFPLNAPHAERVAEHERRVREAVAERVEQTFVPTYHRKGAQK